jgi:hypothetical protein
MFNLVIRKPATGLWRAHGGLAFRCAPFGSYERTQIVPGVFSCLDVHLYVLGMLIKLSVKRYDVGAVCLVSAARCTCLWVGKRRYRWPLNGRDEAGMRPVLNLCSYRADVHQKVGNEVLTCRFESLENHRTQRGWITLRIAGKLFLRHKSLANVLGCDQAEDVWC